MFLDALCLLCIVGFFSWAARHHGPPLGQSLADRAIHCTVVRILKPCSILLDLHNATIIKQFGTEIIRNKLD
jgi:hypothetical protein